MGWVMMSEREVNRIKVLSQIDDGSLSPSAGAHILDLSRRQVFRLLKIYQNQGAAAIRHKARGRSPNNRLSSGLRDYAITLIREKYADFGPTLAAEMLGEHHALKVSSEIIRTLVDTG